MDNASLEAERGNEMIAATRKFARRVGLALTAGFVLVFLVGGTIPSSGVPELERSIIELNGFLIAFVGIVFTGMVAEVRLRTELGVGRQRELSRALRREALGSFLAFMLALVTSVAMSVLALSPPFDVRISVAFAEIFPLSFTIMGLALLVQALAQYADMDAPQTGEKGEQKPSETDGKEERGTAKDRESISKESRIVSSESKTDPKSDFDREEKRLLVALGFLGLLIVFRPSIPFASVTAAVIGLSFYGLVAAWGGYALCMLIYFSDDMFSESWRRRVHRIGLMLLYAFPVFFLTFAVTLGVGAQTGNPTSTFVTTISAAIIDTATLFWLWKRIKN